MDATVIPQAAFRLSFVAQSLKGDRYDKNEDALLSLPERGLFAVVDGMGGHAGGAVASGLVVQHFLGECALLQTPPTKEWLLETIAQANRLVYQQALQQPILKGMGCTLSLLHLDEITNQATCFQVGDSRVYCLHNFRLTQLTVDHTKNFNDLGLATAEHTGQRGITRAMGVRPTVKVDCTSHAIDEQSEFLLVTDGLTDMLADFEMTNILTEAQHSYSSRVDRLIELANHKGGSDDKTAIFIGVQEGGEN